MVKSIRWVCRKNWLQAHSRAKLYLLRSIFQVNKGRGSVNAVQPTGNREVGRVTPLAIYRSPRVPAVCVVRPAPTDSAESLAASRALPPRQNPCSIDHHLPIVTLHCRLLI